MNIRQSEKYQPGMLTAVLKRKPEQQPIKNREIEKAMVTTDSKIHKIFLTTMSFAVNFCFGLE